MSASLCGATTPRSDRESEYAPPSVAAATEAETRATGGAMGEATEEVTGVAKWEATGVAMGEATG